MDLDKNRLDKKDETASLDSPLTAAACVGQHRGLAVDVAVDVPYLDPCKCLDPDYDQLKRHYYCASRILQHTARASLDSCGHAVPTYGHSRYYCVSLTRQSLIRDGTEAVPAFLALLFGYKSNYTPDETSAHQLVTVLVSSRNHLKVKKSKNMFQTALP